MIVLDTHAWVWWIGAPESLSAAARSRIDDEAREGDVRVSSISVWEVAALVRRNRLELSMRVSDWLAASEALPLLQFVPVDNHIALQAEFLPKSVPSDPADRIIVATANALGADLVTRDRKLRDHLGSRAVW